MSLKAKKEQTADLFQSAREVVFGHDGAQMAAEDGAAGSVEAVVDLSARDKRMLAIGALAGAAAAVSRSRFPFESGQDFLERADLVMDYARSVDCRDRRQGQLFTDEAVTV